MSTEYLELADYLAIAAEITGLDEQTITKVTKLDLADSALHAPATAMVRRTPSATTLTEPGRHTELTVSNGNKTTLFRAARGTRPS